MGIFDSLFGRSPDYKLPDIPNTSVGEALTEAQQKQKDYEKSMPCYQVGFTADNRVTLRLSGDYSPTLTMTTEGVRHLIRQLEAAIPEYEVDDTVEANEEE